jgi:hypothetical protein
MVREEDPYKEAIDCLERVKVAEMMLSEELSLAIVLRTSSLYTLFACGSICTHCNPPTSQTVASRLGGPWISCSSNVISTSFLFERNLEGTAYIMLH